MSTSESGWRRRSFGDDFPSGAGLIFCEKFVDSLRSFPSPRHFSAAKNFLRRGFIIFLGKDADHVSAALLRDPVAYPPALSESLSARPEFFVAFPNFFRNPRRASER